MAQTHEQELKHEENEVAVTELAATEHATTQATEEHGAGGEGLAATLGLNTTGFISQLINFALVFAIVWFLILKPLTKKLDERRKIIDESLDRAKEVESNFVMSEQKFQETIAEAKKEANAIVQNAHDEAERMSNEMREKAKAEIAGLVDKAKKSIASEKEEMRDELRKETVTLVVAVTEKILGEKLDAKKDEKFIRDILESVK